MAFPNMMKKFSDSKSKGNGDKLADKMDNKKKKKSSGINMGPSKKFMLNKKLMTQ